MEQLTAIDKAVEVLFHLRGQTGPVGVTEIGRALSLPKSSAHRLLSTLCRRDLVERDDRGRYRLGVGLLALGLGVLEQDPLVSASRQVLETEAGRLGETFFLVAARAGRLVVLDKAEGTGVLRAAPPVGSTIPPDVTAVGKLYMAHAPELLNMSSVEGELADAAEAARGAGYATNHGEWIGGLSVWAAPLFIQGRMSGAVATAVPSGRAEQLDTDDLAARVMAAAAAIEARAEGRAA